MKNFGWLVAVALVVACGDNGSGDESASTGADDTAGDTMNTPTGGVDEGDAQTPPMGYEAIEAWITAGHYKDWKSQTMVVDPISISPHGKQKIFTNDKLSSHGDGEYPVGTAAVKELYDAAGASIIGYAVYLHVSAGTEGKNWYWYERVPLDSPVPHDDMTGVVADGLGDSGTAMSICVTCHKDAGIDAMHPGHDFVYTQLP
jgi:hypothetical protein